MSIDDLDETFARDLEKIGKNVPSELALNAAKVKAVQDPKKPGAEKPDLGAPGLKKKASIDEDLEKDAFSVTREGHKFDAERAKDRKEYLLRRSVALQKKDALGHSGKDGKNPAKLTSAMRFNNEGHTTAGARHQAYIEKKHREGKNAYNPFGGSMTKVKEEKGSTPGLLGTFGKVVKKASIDEEFDSDLRQIVGADSAESVPDFERPCVKVAGQTTDLIDDAYVSWMREQADEDLVKAASSMNLARSVSYPTTKNIADAIDKGKRGAAVKGALGAMAVLGTAALAHKLVKGRTKTAGVIENPENKDLLARIRAKAGGSVDI